MYTALANAIRSATVATLAANPVGILNLIENQYRVSGGGVVWGGFRRNLGWCQ